MNDINLPAIPERVLSLEVVTIHNDVDEANAVDGLAFVQTVRKKIEEARTELKRPHLEAGRRIDESAKPLLEKLDGVIGHLKKAILVYKQAKIDVARAEEERRQQEYARQLMEAEKARQREAAEAAEKARLAAIDAGGFEDDAEEAAAEAVEEVSAMVVAPPRPVPVPEATTKASIGSATLQRRWTFEVLDQRAVPHDYLMVNEVAIRADIRAGIREIPGIRIYQEEIITGRRSA